MRWRMKNCWSMQPLQNVRPPIRSARACRKLTEKNIDSSRVTDIEEISGNGVTAKVDGIAVAAGNAKLMEKLGIAYKSCSM